MNIEVKFEIGQRVSIDGQGNYKVVGYEYLHGRGLRYILLNGNDYLYQYETELEPIIICNTLGFITKT